MSSKNKDFARLAKPPLVVALGQGISLSICKRVLAMDIKFTRAVVTREFLDAVGNAGARILVPAACILEANLKERILRTYGDFSDFSEDGF